MGHLIDVLISTLAAEIADQVAARLRVAEPEPCPLEGNRLRVVGGTATANTTEPKPSPGDASTPAPASSGESREYLTTREAAELLGMTVRGLEGMRAQGRGPKYLRVGRYVRYRRSDLG